MHGGLVWAHLSHLIL